MTLGAVIMTYVWPYATGKSSLIAVAVIYGYAHGSPYRVGSNYLFRFTSSAYVSAFTMPLYNMGVIEDVGRRMGTVMVFAAMGAVAGPPISGAINATAGGTKSVSYYAGVTFIPLFAIKKI